VTASAPDQALRTASALVFVEDLDRPLLSEDDAHHLGDVLRLKPGEQVAAADGKGGWRICAFTTSRLPRPARGASKATRPVSIEVAGPVNRLESPTPRLEIAFSWAKTDRTEWAVAKLVELGIDRLTPLVADRTVVRPADASGARRESRLRRIVREAAMQSRRPLLPEIGTSQSVDDLIGRSSVSTVALAEPGGGPLSLETPIVLVGPEGGWSSREMALVGRKVSLGDGVLRIETAALTAGALLTALRSGIVAAPS
jgi:16S rRNA (uracil1498-N3)-methyltransferase